MNSNIGENMKNKMIDISVECGGPYGWGARLTGAKASKDRKYIKSLAKCIEYATMKDIYPGVKNPIQHELVSLVKLGLLKKYTTEEHIKHVSNGFGSTYPINTKIWWKATKKGINLLKRVGAI